MSDTQQQPPALPDALATLVSDWDIVYACPGGPRILYLLFGFNLSGTDPTYSLASRVDGTANPFAGSDAQAHTAELLIAAVEGAS